jgi:VanZ family protein
MDSDRSDKARPAAMFVSVRERRLWMLTSLLVVAIYSTLGSVRILSDALRGRGLLEPAFGEGVAAIAVAIVLVAMRKRPSGAEIGVWLGVAAVYLMMFVRLAIPEERTHLIEYGVVAALIYEALIERSRAGRLLRSPALLAIVVTAVVGIVDEVFQWFLPGRVFDPRDILFNVLAAVMAVAASWVVSRVRRRTRSPDRGA